MTKSPSPALSIKPYHHGDLRRALLDAAHQLNEDAGPEGLTLREVARRAGVSHAAPYRHFSDKAALIEALALDGWQELTRQLQLTRDAHVASGGPASIAALGVTYVQYATRHPAVFRLMVRPELSRSAQGTPLHTAAQEAFTVLVSAIQHGQLEGQLRAGDAQELSLTAWSAVHGLSVILLDQLLPHRPEQVQALAESVTSGVVGGLTAAGESL